MIIAYFYFSTLYSFVRIDQRGIEIKRLWLRMQNQSQKFQGTKGLGEPSNQSPQLNAI